MLVCEHFEPADNPAFSGTIRRQMHFKTASITSPFPKVLIDKNIYPVVAIFDRLKIDSHL